MEGFALGAVDLGLEVPEADQDGRSLTAGRPLDGMVGMKASALLLAGVSRVGARVAEQGFEALRIGGFQLEGLAVERNLCRVTVDFAFLSASRAWCIRTSWWGRPS